MALRALAFTLLAAVLVAGCAAPMAGMGGPFAQADRPVGLSDISSAALAALPSGMDPRLLIRDRAGCYGIAVEATEPPSGIALFDANGQPVCDA